MALTKTHNRMIAGAVVNVLDYGADITGSVDSKAAIQATGFWRVILSIPFRLLTKKM